MSYPSTLNVANASNTLNARTHGHGRTALRLVPGMALAWVLMTGLGVPGEVWAGAAATTTNADPFLNLKNFVNTFRDAIQFISVVVVTLAIAFSGYQIAFNNKRVGDVAPVLIGGVIVGLAGAVASFIAVIPTT